MARKFVAANSRWITLPSGFSLPAGPVSLAMWLNWTGTTGQSPFSGAMSHNLMIYLPTAHINIFEANIGSVLASTSTISSNAWIPVGFTVSSANGTGQIFINGTLDKSSSITSGLINATNGALIGTDVGQTLFFDGGIADLACWNVVLSANEFAALGQGARPSTIRPAALTGYWPLDGQQSPEPDYSGLAHNGTLTGAISATQGPPLALMTPRQPQALTAAAAATTAFRRTLSPVGTRAGSRQVQV